MSPPLSSRALLLSLLLLLSCFPLHAQIRFRHYQPGRYYDKAGIKHTGFVDFGANFWGTVKINFREGSDTAANQKIGISDLQAVVIVHPPDTTDTTQSVAHLMSQKTVIDSFVVVQENDENSFNPNATDARLCKFVTDAVNAKIYSRNVKKSGGGFGMGIGSVGLVSMAVGASIQYTDTLYLCEADGKTLQLRRSNYKELLAKAFADDPDLVQKIQTKKLKFGELNEIIRRYVARKSI